MEYGRSLYGRYSSDIDALRRLGVEVPEPTTEGSPLGLHNLRPGGFGSDVRALDTGQPPNLPPGGDLPIPDLGHAPVPANPIKDAAVGNDTEVNARRLNPRVLDTRLGPGGETVPYDQRGRSRPVLSAADNAALEAERLARSQGVKSAAGGSPRFVPPPAPSLDLNSTREEMQRPMLSYSGRDEDLTSGAANMRPPADPTNFRDPLTSEVERRAPSMREYNSTPTRDEYLEQNRPHGIGRRVLSGLKLGGKLLVASGLNPIAAAEGIGIGLADRDANARFTYNTDIEPRQRRLLSNANQEMGLANTVEDNRRAEDLGRQTADWHRTQVEGQQREWKERLQEKTLNDWMARNPGMPIPRQIAEQVGHPYLSGYTPPARKTGTGRGPAPHVLFNEKTGEVGVVVYDDDGNPSMVKPQGGQMTPSPKDATNDDYEAQTLAGKDMSTELEQRMNDRRGLVYQRFGIDPQHPENSLSEALNHAEDVLHREVKEAMDLEQKQEAARARVAGRRLGARPQGGWPRTNVSMDQAKGQARSMVQKILADPNRSASEKANARKAYQDEFREEYR